MPDGAKITMENNPTETTQEVAVESAEAETTTQEPATNDAQPDSSSTEEDLTALIEEEKKRGKPDPTKARERFEKKAKREEEEPEEDVDEDDRPLTRREMMEMLAEQNHRTNLENQADSIQKLSEEYAQTTQEAELIRSIHANRIFPVGMSLREQMAEAAAIANVKRTEARNAELARKIQSQNTVSRNTATTHRDPQAGTEPDLAPDLKASMVRAGFTYNSTSRRYEKKLPNGTTLVKEPGKPPYQVG